MLELNGGSGGGQLLRTALSLSICTATPFRMVGIRADRAKPGLMRQHLTAVNAAASISDAMVHGASPGSLELEFVPGAVRPGDHHFSIGTAGSTTLVLQTVLPALMSASAPSSVRIEGGTHNPMAPSSDFLASAFLPLLQRMGIGVDLSVDRYGFYPAGGGLLHAVIRPGRLQRLMLSDRGALTSVTGRALISAIPSTVAERELAVVARRLGLAPEHLEHRSVRPAVGPGNALTITVTSEHLCEVFTSLGERGVSAEAVAERACTMARTYLDTGTVVGEYLADQLLLPLALAGGGSFSTCKPSEHFRSNAALIAKFLPVHIEAEPVPAQGSRAAHWSVHVA